MAKSSTPYDHRITIVTESFISLIVQAPTTQLFHYEIWNLSCGSFVGHSLQSGASTFFEQSSFGRAG